ncbi:MAG: MFS transporter [Patescibacteria group bacterium]
MSKKATILGIKRNVFFLSVVSLLNDASSDMIYPLIPLFLSSVLGATYTTIGIIEGVAESTAATLRVFSGSMSDRVRKRKIFTIIGYSFSTVVKPILAIATKPWHVLIVRFLDRTGKAIRSAPRDALIADSIEMTERGKSFGFHKMMDTMGAALGPLVAFMLLRFFQGNFRPVFFLSFVAGAIAVCTLILFTSDAIQKIPSMDQGSSKSKITLHHIKELLKGPFLWFLAASILFALGNSSDAFLLLRAQNLGVATALIPIIYFIFNIVFAGFSYPLGKLSDKINRKILIMAGYFIFIAVYLGFANATAPWHAWALFGAYGLYYAFTEGVQKALIADFVPETLRATAYGAFHTLTGIALLPASIIAGSLWQRFGAQAPFLWGSFTAIGAILLFLPLISQKKSGSVPIIALFNN